MVVIDTTVPARYFPVTQIYQNQATADRLIKQKILYCQSTIPEVSLRSKFSDEPHIPSQSSTPQEDRTSIQDLELVPNLIPSRLDWVPKSELSAEQRSALPGNCCGTYVDPLVHLSPIENEPDTLETTFVSRFWSVAANTKPNFNRGQCKG